MKGLFVQLGQWLWKYKKRMIYGALALFIVQFCFFNLGNFGVDSVVYAAEGETPAESKSFDTLVQEKTGLISFFEKALYVIIYPFLFLVGKLVDNSFVYGEVFGFDAILWKLWNIMRNFANYGLGFIFVYYIFKYLIKKDEKQGPKWLIIRALIAGVGIQATWFAMGALIDVSTILTYSVGGLPLSILENESKSTGEVGDNQDSWNYNPYSLKMIVTIDGDDIADPDTYMATIKTGGQIGEEIISACSTFRYQNDGIKEDLILAPRMVYYQKGTGFFQTMEKVCHYYGQIYWFLDLHDDVKALWPSSCSNETDCKNKQLDYDGGGNEDKGLAKVKKDLQAIGSGEMRQLIKDAKVLEIGNAHVTGGIHGGIGLAGSTGFNVKLECEQCGFDVDNKWIGSGKTLKMSELIKSDQTSNSYVTVFSSLYESLLNSGRSVFAVSDEGIYVKFLRALLTFGTMIAIAVPLVVAALVFLMRIGIIWIAIVLSPAIVLLTVFDGLIKIEDKSFLSYLKLENLIGIIFSPAVVCFAVSMSLVLVKMIERISTSPIETESLILGGIIQVNLAGFTVGLGQLIIAFMGIAITWFLVWTAIQASKLGKKAVIGSLRKMANDALGTVPIVPFPQKGGGVGMIGANSAFGLNGHNSAIDTGINKWQDKIRTRNTTAIDELFDPGKAARNALNNEAEAFGTSLLQQNVGANWQDMDIPIVSKNGNSENRRFSQLNEGQKKIVLDKINSADESTRKKFNGSPEVVISGVTYQFVGGEGKNRFEEKTTN